MKKQIILSLIFFLFACSTSSDISINSQKKIPQSVAVVFTAYSGQFGHRFRFNPATFRSEATLAFHYTSKWPE